VATSLTSVVRPKPGRLDDTLGLIVEVSKLLERHGSPDNRALVGSIAGEETASIAFTSEFETGEQLGATIDELVADSEYSAWLNRASAETSPAILLSRSVAIEIPLGRSGSRDRGSVVEVYLSRMIPGRLDSVMELTTAAFDFLEANGATSCRLLQLQNAGSLSEALVATWEFENMRAYGRAADAFMNDPKGQAVTEMLTSATNPINVVTSSVYRDAGI
jgi:hypothetical protein